MNEKTIENKASILSAKQVNKTYQSGDNSLQVLRGIDFDIFPGEIVSIIGPSGSGKTTLLGLCAGLDNPTEGMIRLCGQELSSLSENEKAVLRNENVGFVFQNFQLIPTLTALENVMIPLELQKNKKAESISKDFLSRVGLGDRMTHYPTQLSGGEQQRVSIARAFSSNPSILFADEPTGNLDDNTGSAIEQLLFDINKEEGTTLVLVTHDMELAYKTQRIIKLKGGEIISDGPSQSTSVNG